MPINDATDILNQEGSKSASRGLWEDDKGKEETEKPERQQHDPAGLGDSHKSRKLDGPPLSSVSNPNEFQNTMNLNTGLNNGMDYNQMMQFMSGNLGNGMANFNPMMGMLKTFHHDFDFSDIFQLCQTWGWVRCRECSGTWVALV